VALGTVACVAALAGLVGTLIQARQARRQRDFALRQLSRAEAINDLNNFLLTDAAPGGKPFTVNDLLSRAEHVVSRQRAADADRAELLVAIGRQYWSQDEDAKARAVLTQAYELSRNLPDATTRGKAACALAAMVARGGDLERAEALFQEGVNQLPERPEYAADRSYCLLRGSDVSRDKGDGPTAVSRAQDALRVLRDSPLRSEMLELRATMDIAESYRVGGMLREAAAAFEQAATHLAGLGRDDTQTAGTLFNNWALTLNMLGRPLDAERIFRRALDVSRADRTEDAVSPMLLNNYARALRDLDRLGEAADYAERAHAKAVRAGDEVVVNQSLILRASVYREQGGVARATTALDEVEPKFRRIFPPGHVSEAAITLQRALIDQAAGNLDAALERIDKALAMVEAIAKNGQEGVDFLPTVLTRRAELQLERHRPDAAIADAKRGLDLLQKAAPAGMFTNDIGRAHLALGRALQEAGRQADARREFEAALQHLESAIGPDHPDTQAVRGLLK
jgi:eukaryotic-like serine/threonine-protein kinase